MSPRRDHVLLLVLATITTVFADIEEECKMVAVNGTDNGYVYKYPGREILNIPYTSPYLSPFISVGKLESILQEKLLNHSSVCSAFSDVAVINAEGKIGINFVCHANTCIGNDTDLVDLRMLVEDPDVQVALADFNQMKGTIDTVLFAASGGGALFTSVIMVVGTLKKLSKNDKNAAAKLSAKGKNGKEGDKKAAIPSPPVGALIPV